MRSHDVGGFPRGGETQAGTPVVLLIWNKVLAELEVTNHKALPMQFSFPGCLIFIWDLGKGKIRILSPMKNFMAVS